MAQPLSIFISSPGDVNDERRRAALVISRLKREFARFFDLTAVLWEYEPMLASGHFQDILVPPSHTDIVVVILWSRLGSPLPEDRYRGLDGRVPVTGTEWEFEDALKVQGQPGAPELLVYRKTAPPETRFTGRDQLETVGRQWDALQAFWGRHFVFPDGRARRAFKDFDGLDEFEAKLKEDLRKILRRRGAEGGRDGSPRLPDWYQGSPFRGLDVFEPEHARIFFGRGQAEREVTEALAARAGARRGWCW
jgi:hypothetical protein